MEENLSAVFREEKMILHHQDVNFPDLIELITGEKKGPMMKMMMRVELLVGEPIILVDGVRH